MRSVKIALTLISAAVLALAFSYPLLVRGESAAPKAAKELVANGALLLDVRTPAEFAAGHVAGAVNIPVQELDRRMNEVGAKDKPVVIYCRSGNRSAKAKRMLEAAGYKTVHDIGPMPSW